ncbi:MAG: hypothetical protein ABL949_11520 [Fimbriimonadaceae bacterium]
MFYQIDSVLVKGRETMMTFTKIRENDETITEKAQSYCIGAFLAVHSRVAPRLAVVAMGPKGYL